MCAAQRLPIVVVGAHLSGLPLNYQLVERGASLQLKAMTAKKYKLYAFASEKKPGLIQVDEPQGHSIPVEVWSMPMEQVGSFLALVPPPLSIGHVELDSGETYHCFRTDEYSVKNYGAIDISHLGGWRGYLQSLEQQQQQQ